MKKFAFVTTVFISLNSFSQNLIQNNLGISNRNFIQAQNVRVFASNAMLNNSGVNRPAAVRTSQHVIQRTRSSNTIQRRQASRRITSTNNMVQGQVQTNQVQIHPPTAAESNNDLQLQNAFTQMENNIGNSFGNQINPAIQMALPELPEIPAIQLKNVNMDFNINLPGMSFKPIKLSGKSVSSQAGNSYKLIHTKNRLIKFNRKVSAKLSLKKKLKIKVDDCFKW